jgi:anhydro-N-acetylmuramic acid kinase
MSGTSADGIDAALVRLSGQGWETAMELVGYDTYPHSGTVRDKILELAVSPQVMVTELCGLNVILARQFAWAAKELAEQAGYSLAEVDLIGCHGQTIRHLPNPYAFLDQQVTATWQIGDPAIIAKMTGVTTIGDFRVADMAWGGQGAPFVPYLDYLLFRSPVENRMCLNMGGISNITYLPKRAESTEVLAFDVGPGNMLIDQVMRRYYQLPFDKDGRMAASGYVDEILLQHWLQEPFYHQAPPKSTGRELFAASYVDRLKNEADEQKRSLTDFLATVTALTAEAIYLNYKLFVLPRGPVARLYASGGGCKNFQIMQRLQKLFSNVNVCMTDQAGWPSAAKEAVCFALLAHETLCGRTGNLPSVTGASRATILGKICPSG